MTKQTPDLKPGSPERLGATVEDSAESSGVNFALFSYHATEVALGFAGRCMGDLRTQQPARHAECQPAIACQGRALLGA